MRLRAALPLPACLLPDFPRALLRAAPGLGHCVLRAHSASSSRGRCLLATRDGRALCTGAVPLAKGACLPAAGGAPSTPRSAVGPPPPLSDPVLEPAADGWMAPWALLCQKCSERVSGSVVSDFGDPVDCNPPGACPNSLRKNTAVGSHSLLQGGELPHPGMEPSFLHCTQILDGLSTREAPLESSSNPGHDTYWACFGRDHFCLSELVSSPVVRDKGNLQHFWSASRNGIIHLESMSQTWAFSWLKW